ncbi:nuclear pore complex protein Nup98-Nup96-like protein [Aphelenchoides avenae]|nr:nuclear pore complex protein Nup98-Nup96-like protein [Aphelenchus avenae]
MNVLFPPCRLCAEAHPELSCTKYRTPDERQSRVRSLNRCTQCLDATDLDHVGLCPNDRRCLKCSGAHHEALCAVQFTAPLGTSQSGTSGASSTTALPSFRFITSKTSVQPPVAPFEFTLSPVKPKFHPDPSIPQPNSKTEEKDATCASPISSVSNAPETGSKDNTGTMASSGDLFEQNKPSLFGSSQQNAFSTTTPSTGLFRSGIAGAQGARTGTTIKFDAPRDKDTIMQNKEMQWIDTRHVCITAMREYDGKSFEELRMEDNLDHRKSGTAGGTSLVRSQQAAPTLGSTAGATGGGGLCGGLSQNTPRLVSDPSAKTARPVVSCASSSSSPSSSKTPDVIARAVQQPAGNPTKREGPAASSEQSKKAATTSKQEHASSKSQVHTRSTLWKTPEAPCAPSEQAVKADAVVNALPTATLTAEVIQTRKASCLAAEAVVPSVVTNSVSMKLPAVRSTTTSTLCAASAGALSPTSEVSAQVSTSAGTGSTRHTSDPSATIGIHCNGRKRKAEDNARLDNDGQTEMRTPSASTGDKSEKISQLQNAPSSGTGADKLADSSEARKGATSTSQDRPKQAPKRIKPTTTGTNNHPEVPARVVPSVKLRDTASKRQPSGDSSALTRAQHSASAMSDKQADPSEAMKGATSETPSHCPKDAYEEPPRVTPQTNGRIQAHSANVSEPTNISRAISYGCTPLSAAVRSTVAPKGRSSERPSVSGYKPKAAASLVNASVENGDSGVSKPPDGSVTNTPPLAGSSTDWAARFNDVARRAREDAQKTLAEGLQKLFEQTQILETEAEEIFEVERRRLDDEREKLTEMKADISKRRQAIKIKEMKLSTKERRLRDMEQKLNADQRSVDAAREDLVIDRLNMEEERRERIDALPNYEQHVQNERILAEYRLQLEAKEARLQQRAQELEGVFVDLQQQKAAFEEDKLQQASKSRSRSPHSSSRRSSGHVVKSEAVSSSSRRYSSLRDAEEEICRLKRRLKSARDDVDDAHRELRCIKEKRGDESPRRRDAIDESLRKQLDEAKQKHRAQEEALSRAKSERCAAEMKADVAEKTLAEQKAAHTEKVEGLTTEIEILRWSLEFRRQRSERKIKEAKARKQHQMRQKRGVPGIDV